MNDYMTALLERFGITAPGTIETEERARKQFERERGEHDGETQAVR